MSESIRTYIDLISGIKPFPKEWWRVNFLIEECIKDKHYAAAYDILMMWRKTNIVSSASYSALISICRATLDEIEQIGDLEDSKAKELMKLLEAEDFQYLFKDGQRAINLVEGSKKIQVSGLLDDIKCKYKKLVDSLGECVIAGNDKYDSETVASKPIVDDSQTNRINKEQDRVEQNHIVKKESIEPEKINYVNWDEIEFTKNNNHMKILETYSKAVKDSTAILEAVLSDQSSGIINDAQKIVKGMESECAVRVPFVGDFNAGKSTLLNTMLDMDLLPTNITPETAVSYELIYSPNEHLEVYKDGNSVGEYPLADIKTLRVQPGDTVKVFLNKELLRECREKGLMLVDMPGIDSGIQAHNAAIVKYLRPGTRYMVFSDAEQGTIRSTALSFIKELGKYEDIDFSIFLSKCDKKTPEEIEKVKSAATDAVSTIYPGHSVGVTSSFNKDYNDVLVALNSIDAESILGRKYKIEVSSILDQMIQSLQRNIQLLAGNIKDADKAISEISEKKRSRSAIEWICR